MDVHVGDELIIDGHRVGEAARHGEVVEVRGADGGPPYVVRWDESGRTTLLFPGPDCRVKHLGEGTDTGTTSDAEVSS